MRVLHERQKSPTRKQVKRPAKPQVVCFQKFQHSNLLNLIKTKKKEINIIFITQFLFNFFFILLKEKLINITKKLKKKVVSII
jgi:hypothetical protein